MHRFLQGEQMSKYICNTCGFTFDEEKEGSLWEDLPEDWMCPICGSAKSIFDKDDSPPPQASAVKKTSDVETSQYLEEWSRTSDNIELHMPDIHLMAETGYSISEPMRTPAMDSLWDDILVKGAQLSKIPLNEDAPVNTQTVIGPKAKHPLIIETPVYVTHMSYGALSMEAKLALSKGSAAVKTAMCSGEGGILPESLSSAYKYIFEYVPNRYSVTKENIKKVDAIEIKIGQSAKPGLGGHLPGSKVTMEIADIRGRPAGEDIISPAHFEDIQNGDDLKAKVAELREMSEGKPIGIKFAAGSVEADLAVAVYAEPDFITIDGRAGGTGSAPKFIKNAASVPTIFALCRAHKYLDDVGVNNISLVITGGFRISSDFVKALALGANAVAIGTAAMMAIGCQQYRICNTGKCPVGITAQDPALRNRLSVDKSTERLANYLGACTRELKDFARMTGNDDIHNLSPDDLCTMNSEISGHTPIEHV